MNRRKPYHTDFVIALVTGLVGCVIGDIASYEAGWLNPAGMLIGVLITVTYAYWGVYVPRLRKYERSKERK